jgi:hypothetical protein
MRKHPRVSGRPSVDQCFCSPVLGFICSLHRGGKTPEPDLTGYGYRTGYSLDPDGAWISPEQDKDEEFLRAVGIIFEAESPQTAPPPRG